ncbi:hypothetical protein IFM89_035211 [Coptis chinensis]|uniref:Btz domain-containing protein n=1 Tax=Coptis chinensis TaxID=261450 RepID=A0A835IIY7_9MAGN|nr:hypothetical protein IFM89_035211 [Coptis chinensis]
MVLEEEMVVKGEEKEEEEEYESDPEEVVKSLAMRRRVASDDEEEIEGERVRNLTGGGVASDVGSESDDGQGEPEVYDDDEEEEDEEEYEEVDKDAGKVEVTEGIVGGDDEKRSNVEIEGKEDEVVEGEKKENEPFAVPTAGAFYMHDDRFRENGGGRHRKSIWTMILAGDVDIELNYAKNPKTIIVDASISVLKALFRPLISEEWRTPGGRKLWESKDVRKWGHDKYIEMNSQERENEKDGRNFRGQYRGRGRNRGLDRRSVRGNRPRAYDDRNNQNQTVRTVRGRGPRRYEPLARNNRETPTQNKQSGKSHESPSNTTSGRVSTSARSSNVQSDSAPSGKHVFASSLNSASPPFYPSGSSNHETSQTQKRELPGGNSNKSLRPSVTSENRTHSTTFVRGKNVADVADRVYFDDDLAPQEYMGKFNNMQLQSSGSLPKFAQSPQIKSNKGRGLATPEKLHYQPLAPINQVSRTHAPTVHQRPGQNTVQTSFRASSQQLGQHLTGSQASSPPRVSPRSSSEPGETESPPGSSKSKTALVGKGKGTVQGNGRGSFLYNGAQVMGASGSMGLSHGDQNFPAPALLQVMQFGGQHPGGMGVPAVGMALPGYVAQPGFGNSEMTWVPVLAGAAGALGASYCSPYLTVDGGYYGRPTGQTSSSAASSSVTIGELPNLFEYGIMCLRLAAVLLEFKELITNKPNDVLKPSQRSELVNDEFGQRQNKPRRYSEMNFGQGRA